MSEVSVSAENDLLEPYAAPEIFVDGFTKHTSRDGVMTCVGYRNMPEGRVIVVRLVWPAVNTGAAMDDANEAVAVSKLIGPKKGAH